MKLLLDSLPCFDKYAAPVKEQLARVVRYESHGAGTALLRQGDEGQAFYYIISGTVSVSIAAAPGEASQVVQTMGKNDSFGGLALLSAGTCIRTATVTVAATAEFLCIGKHEFDHVLRASHAQERRHMWALLRANPFFRAWADAELHDALSSVQLREVAAGSLAVDGIRHSCEGTAPDSVFVLVSGACRFIRCVTLPTALAPAGGGGGDGPAANMVTRREPDGPCASGGLLACHDKAGDTMGRSPTLRVSPEASDAGDGVGDAGDGDDNDAAGPAGRPAPERPCILTTTSRDMPLGSVFAHCPRLAVLCRHKTVLLAVGRIVFMRHDHGVSLQVR